jgi:hypothetical protein
VDVDYVVVADAVTSANGKHYIHGGGWDSIQSAVFPAVHSQVGVAIRLRIGWHDTNQNHELALDIQDADNTSILPAPLVSAVNAGRPPTLAVGEDQVLCLALAINGLQFPKPGDYSFVVALDGVENVRQVVHVRLAPAVAGAVG